MYIIRRISSLIRPCYYFFVTALFLLLPTTSFAGGGAVPTCNGENYLNSHFTFDVDSQGVFIDNCGKIKAYNAIPGTQPNHVDGVGGNGVAVTFHDNIANRINVFSKTSTNHLNLRNSITISTWIYWEDKRQSNLELQGIYSDAAVYPNQGTSLMVGGDGSVHWYFYDANGKHHAMATPPAKVEKYSWNYIVAGFGKINESSELRQFISINGEIFTQVVGGGMSVTAPAKSINDPIAQIGYIGKEHASIFNGIIDELKIYSKALSVDEIEAAPNSYDDFQEYFSAVRHVNISALSYSNESARFNVTSTSSSGAQEIFGSDKITLSVWNGGGTPCVDSPSNENYLQGVRTENGMMEFTLTHRQIPNQRQEQYCYSQATGYYTAFALCLKSGSSTRLGFADRTGTIVGFRFAANCSGYNPTFISTERVEVRD